MRGEWVAAERWAKWAWLPLVVLIAVPFPMYRWPLPERGVPIMWLVLGGTAWIVARIARASVPFALLCAWAVWRSAMAEWSMRALQVLLVTAMVGLLYAAARDLPFRAEPWLAAGIVLGLSWEGLIGWLNLWRTGLWIWLPWRPFEWTWLPAYPWMAFTVPSEAGRPMAFLTHPNYFGSLMALGLPVIWAATGVLPALFVFALILASYSPGPVLAASAGVALLLWRRATSRARFWLGVGLSAATTIVLTVHLWRRADGISLSQALFGQSLQGFLEWHLSGRWQVWSAIWPEMGKWPWIGQGFGGWRTWAEHYNAKHGCCPATLQAHSEPYQLWFELGLIGLALGALWAWQAWSAGRRAWAGPIPTHRAWYAPGWLTLREAWVAVVLIAGVNMLGSPTFHLPGQAAFTVLALARMQAWAWEADAHRAS